MIQSRKKNTSHEQQSFVAEQNGKPFAFLGIGFSLFVGLAIQATFSPDKILILAQAAADRVHPNIEFKIASAELSLSDGLFPEFAILIHDVAAKGKFPHCPEQPTLTVDEIRLPMDFWSLLKGQMKLSTVQLGQVELAARFDLFETCRAGSVADSSSPLPRKLEVSEKSTTTAGAVGTNLILDQIRAESRHPVHQVSIQSLRFLNAIDQRGKVELRQVMVRTKAENEGALLEGQVVFLMDPVGGYSVGSEIVSKASLRAEYSKKPQETLEAQLHGAWREGSYDVSSILNLQDQTLLLDLKAQHLPVSQILNLLKGKDESLDPAFDGKQAWFSGDVSTKGSRSLALFREAKVPVEMANFLIDGDLGEVQGQNIRMTRQHPIQLSPFELSFRGVKLDQVFKILNFNPSTTAIQDWGQFNGNFSYRDKMNMSLIGEHSGLQVIFSNRGHRELQTFSLVGGRALNKNGIWELVVDQVRPLDGLFLGGIKIKVDEEFRNGAFDVNVSEMSLSPTVQKLMTGGGALGSWSGRLQGRIQEGKTQIENGLFDVTDLNIENFAFARGRVSLLRSGNHFDFELLGKKAVLDASSPLFDFLAPVIADQRNEKQQVLADVVKLTLETQDFSQLKWKLTPAQLTRSSFSSEGGWDHEGVLFGHLLMKSQTRHDWSLRGTRSAPVLEKESPK